MPITTWYYNTAVAIQEEADIAEHVFASTDTLPYHFTCTSGILAADAVSLSGGLEQRVDTEFFLNNVLSCTYTTTEPASDPTSAAGEGNRATFSVGATSLDLRGKADSADQNQCIAERTALGAAVDNMIDYYINQSPTNAIAAGLDARVYSEPNPVDVPASGDHGATSTGYSNCVWASNTNAGDTWGLTGQEAWSAGLSDADVDPLIDALGSGGHLKVAATGVNTNFIPANVDNTETVRLAITYKLTITIQDRDGGTADVEDAGTGSTALFPSKVFTEHTTQLNGATANTTADTLSMRVIYSMKGTMTPTQGTA